MTNSLNLDSDVSLILGIGKKKKEKLNLLNIFTVRDLLLHYPFRYKDKRNLTRANFATQDKDSLVRGILIKKDIRQLGGRKSISEFTFSDDGYNFSVIFFNMPYIAKTLDIGAEYVIFGKMKQKYGKNVWYNPEIVKLGSDNDIRGIIPVYRCTQGITTNDFIKWITYALNNLNLDDDWLDDDIRQNNRMCDQAYAYKNIHFPKSVSDYKIAKYRLIYDELLTYQIAILQNKRRLSQDFDASVDVAPAKPFIEGLPFALTEGQIGAINDIESDLLSVRPMNRLVQGDVGCGKTVVAETAIFQTVKAGYQAAYMAPTEILARQHFARLSSDFEKHGIIASLLTSDMKASQKNETLQKILSGEIDVVVGTHAIIQKNIEFNNLALVITDEQHRFGVNQRKMLSEKTIKPNVLVMTATPIPRTLAATVYGDMDYSIIKTKPTGRKNIVTQALSKDSRQRAYVALREELQKGNKGYVIAPSIENEEEDITSVESLYSEIKKNFKGYKVAIIHGKLSSKEKEEIMTSFNDGDIDILVATVVIEVGIDVKDATIIIIENSERFGLAQLHQLRGRVGRSSKDSFCYLINYSDSDVAKARARAMVTMPDGFDISEADLKIRGPGDLSGTMQHGSINSRILELARHKEILEKASEDAKRIIVNPGFSNIGEINARVAKYDVADNSEVI